jgi:dinuclear metal center YbgI/SA1388 family protein
MKNTVNRGELEQFLASELQIARFRDYCPNGVQVEGRNEIKRIISGVTACQALLEEAVRLKADAILVHHGYFWRGEDMRVIGQKHKRLKILLENDISLFAYHLPLDMHPIVGNNAQLAKKLDLQMSSRFGEDDIIWMGNSQLESLKTVGDLANHIINKLGRAPMLIGDANQLLGNIAWCTGAAQSMLGQAIDAGANVYISGEISEPTVHLARESNVAYLACGHHATERYGVQALGELIEKQFGIEHIYVDINNPV